MILKMFRAVWFLSVIVVLANLLLVYASLPEQVIVQAGTDGNITLSRDLVFYFVMTSVLIVNVLVYILRKMFPEAEDLRAWFHGLVITINIFFVISLHAVNVYNSAEIFDHSRVGFFISGSLGLILFWAAAWPLYLMYEKIFLKQSV